MALHHRSVATCFPVLLGLVVSLTGRAANCPTATFFSSYDHYLFTPGVCPSGEPCPGPTSVTESFAGSFWALGQGDPLAGQGVDNGTWPVREDTPPDETGWVRSYSFGQPASIEGWWGVDSRTDGCLASECMAMMFSDQVTPPVGNEGFFALVTKQELDGIGFVFDSDVVLAPIPRPRIVGSSRLPDGSIQLRIQVDPPAAGLTLDPACASSVLRGYKIYQSRLLHPPADPSDLRRSSWSLSTGGEGPAGAPIPFGSDATIVLHPYCNGWSYYFAASLSFDGGFETAHVSRARGGPMGLPEWTDVDCDGVQPFTPDGQQVLDCDDSDPNVYPGAPQICDHKNNDCSHSSWPALAGTNEAGTDLDSDTWTGQCDNCPADSNPSQSDRNVDGVGDSCDLHDGLILLRFADPGLVGWQEEQGFESWNLYRASLVVLRSTGAYTQAPGSNPIAHRECGIATPFLGDDAAFASGQVAFYLVSGTSGGVENDLGTNSSGQTRANASRCP